MIAWMLFAAGIAVLAAVAAHAAERALRLLRLPGRWAWAAALTLSISLPFLLPRPQRSAGTIGGMETTGAATSPLSAPVAATVRAQTDAPTLDRLDAAMPWAWATGSLAAMGALALAAARLARRRRRWADGTVAGERVLLSDDVGPAVVGFVRPRIVLPRWTLAWAEPMQRLMLRHEREHVRAGDPLLLLSGVLAAALLPWSPALWWQLRRLRVAVEVDCDARTLRGGTDVLSYGRLLLEVGRAGGGSPAPLVGFSEPRSFLEQRITAMTSRIPRHRARRVAAWTAVGALAAATAAALPAPRPPRLPAVHVPAPLGRDTSRVLTLAEVDRQPELANKPEIWRTLARNYPPMLRAAGIEGSVVMDLVVGEDGAVRAPRVTSATRDEFSRAALAAAASMRFRPAEKSGRPVPVRLSLPVAFQLETGVSLPPDAVDAPPSLPVPANLVPLAQVDRQPELANREEIIRFLAQAYPPLLRAAGVQGEARLEVVIGDDGSVRRAQVRATTHEGFREAALAAAGRMRFRPAQKAGKAVATRLVIPVAFQLSTATTVTP